MVLKSLFLVFLAMGMIVITSFLVLSGRAFLGGEIAREPVDNLVLGENSVNHENNESKQFIAGKSNKSENTQATKSTSIILNNNPLIPQTVIIKAGNKIKWINQDSVSHTVTGFGINEMLGPGWEYVYRFNEKGNYSYYCAIHPRTEGKIIVE